MESDLQQQQHLQINSGLTRYRSAPSSYFSSFIDTQISQEILHPRPETERILGRLGGTSGGNTGDASVIHNFRKNYLLNEVIDRQSLMKSEEILQNYYQSSPHPPLPSHNSLSSVDYRNPSPPVKIGGVSQSNLIRQNSSPAGLFSHFNVERAGHMATIPEIENKSIGGSSPDNDEGPSNNYIAGFPVGSWDDSVIMSENIAGMKRFREDDASEIQNLEAGIRPPQRLAHHLSLPKTTTEMNAIEKYLQLQDSVPCKIRAKRGCATHPRSIAERVRRTRISERMRKLQELVPNMDKQTNTSDMLDLAVEYIKGLQRQVRTLSDNRAKCTCSSRQQL